MMELKYRSHFTEWKSTGYWLYFSPRGKKNVFAGEVVCDRNLRIFLGHCEESRCMLKVVGGRRGCEIDTKIQQDPRGDEVKNFSRACVEQAEYL